MRARISSGLLMVAVLAGATPWAALRAAAPVPNVLIVMTDDQGPGTMSPMPETRRWFKRWGVRYDNAYATTPLCCPSRASILTGRYAHNHGVDTNSAVGALDFRTTVPRYLQEAGYRTAYAGKFLNEWSEAPPYFDRWSMFTDPLGDGYTNTTVNQDGTVLPVDAYSTNHLREWTVSLLHQLEHDDGRPWFLMVAPYAPHLPSVPAKRFMDAPVSPWAPNPAVLEEDRTDKPLHVQEADVATSGMKKLRARHLRTLMSVDVLVRRLMNVMGELGERGDTLAFYVSDNGFLMGDHGVKGKRHPYGASIGVPLFARWPGHLVPGTVDTRLVANIDVPATILDAAGVTPSATIDGRSLLAAGQRERLFLEYVLDPGWETVPTWRSILTPELHYIEYLDEGGEVTFREYYDLRDDRWRLENLLADGEQSNDPPAEVLKDLADQAQQGSSCSGTDGPGACP